MPDVLNARSHQRDLKPLRIAVGIATCGRPGVLADTIGDLARQHRLPDSILVAYAFDSDVAEIAIRFPHVALIQCQLGLTRQRNAILRMASGFDVVIFLDDDFYLEPGYLGAIEKLFAEERDVVVATGFVVADGINGPGLTFEGARRILAQPRLPEPMAGEPSVLPLEPVYNAYGCNMSLRMEPIRSHGLWFDERLPLYGWYEDVDFSRQLASYGRVVQCKSAVGVHLGVKSGRTSGVRLGYSQVANPVYLARKGTFRLSHAAWSIASRFAKNLVLSIAPERFVDRRGRLRGNLLGLYELMNGKLEPGRATSL